MTPEPKADLSLSILAHVQKTGRALEILDELVQHEVFRNLSKHNPFWDASDEMDELRMQLSYIQEKISQAICKLEVDPFEGNL